MDKEFFVKVRRGLEFFYYGQGCMVDYYSNTITYLEGIEVEIIKLANGSKKIYELANILDCNSDIVMNCVMNLLDRGIIIARKKCEIVDIKIYGKYGCFYPKEMIVELTSRCNFMCPFCYKNALKKGKDIKWEHMENIVNLISTNVRYIQLTGGEPTLHPEFEKIVKLFPNDVILSMVTNGSLLYEKDLFTLKRFSEIQISLYGTSDAEYLCNTGMTDGYSKLVRSIAVMHDNNIGFSISVTLHKNNIEDLEKYIICAIDLGARVLKVGAADLFGREKNISALDDEYMEKKSELDSEILRLKRKYYSHIKILLNNIEIEEKKDEKKEKLLMKNLPCGSGVDYLVVSQDGNIRPCLYFSENEMDIGKLEQLGSYFKMGVEEMDLVDKVKEIMEKGFYCKNEIAPCWAMKEFYKKYICKGK